MADEVILSIAQEVRTERAGPALLEVHAKLYSQQLRLDMSRPGLSTFSQANVESLLDEAVLLVECGLIEREEAPGSNWRASLQRAAQIVEWLSQENIRPDGAPLHLISAAIYQVADLPAMALGLLRRMPIDDHGSEILKDFLSGDFPSALSAVGSYWRDEREAGLSPSEGSQDADLELSRLSEQHVVKCIGTVCAYLRTGGSVPIERALTKLDRLALAFLHSRDHYSFLLARLVAASARRFVETCLWPHVERLSAGSSERAGQALVQFARAAFMNKRALVWPAQADGIRRLQEEGSFVLCTPTGSGKTTIATLGIVQGLFAEQDDPLSLAGIGLGNLILYLVPSRALAAEVEQRLSEDLQGVDARPVVVTGLYGGVDWGPTDAWIQSDAPAIVICTFEKADALIRYLGILFLNRVRLVVIDEAHMVELDPAKSAELAGGASRALRLEQLGMRLLQAQDTHGFRIIALSAVAAQAGPAIARWIGDGPNSLPVTSTHRSTRQMVGKLEVTSRGTFSIHYSLMDGQSLLFGDGTNEETPYVLAPFGPAPGGELTGGSQVRMRRPVLWAALNLARERNDGLRPAVLISITQQVGSFAKTCADLMDQWQSEELPTYSAIDEEDDAWLRCLASAADYFTEQSVEYRLLKHGIAVHHGQLPPLLARRLKVVIDRRLVRIIIATSTLSEGVNIPVNAVLIPSLFRGTTEMSLQEFTNLIGRAGRPGISTEGSALVVLPEAEKKWDGSEGWNRERLAYNNLIQEMLKAGKVSTDAGAGMASANSPLQNLLNALLEAWERFDGSGTFEEWLARTAVIGEDAADTANSLLDLLDPLDAILIAALQEVAQLKAVELEPAAVESELSRIWRHTYAAAAAANEAMLRQHWITRGLAINRLYPDAAQRRRIYRTSLAPRSATMLLNIAEQLRKFLQTGSDYAQRNQEEQLNFVAEVLDSLSAVPAFEIEPQLKKNVSWRLVLQWWLAAGTLQPKQRPRPDDCTKWFKFANDNFIYRGNWGLGGLVSLLMDNVDELGPIRALEIDDWPRSGLPWIAFWLKELVNWGTLDPVAAFLLARGNAVDRREAEAEAKLYYEEKSVIVDANDLLDPRMIRDWVKTRRGAAETVNTRNDITIQAELVRPANAFLVRDVSVSPLQSSGRLTWLDPAGHVVAISDTPNEWFDDPENYSFELRVESATIVGSAYLRHRNTSRRT